MSYPNGRYPMSALTRVYSTYHTYLADDAAAGMNSLYMYVRRVSGLKINSNGENSDYRDYDTQQYFYKIYGPGRAAYPGTSNHGDGVARDGNWVLQKVYQYRSKWMGWAGWGKTEAFHEPWHFNYVGGFDRPNPGIRYKYPVVRRGSGGPLQAWFVRKVQLRLKVHGFVGVGKIDGEFGDSSVRALKNFQRNCRLRQTGVVNITTWKYLRLGKRRLRRRVRRQKRS